MLNRSGVVCILFICLLKMYTVSFIKLYLFKALSKVNVICKLVLNIYIKKQYCHSCSSVQKFSIYHCEKIKSKYLLLYSTLYSVQYYSDSVYVDFDIFRLLERKFLYSVIAKLKKLSQKNKIIYLQFPLLKPNYLFLSENKHNAFTSGF